MSENRPPKRVLLVDDNPADADLFARALESAPTGSFEVEAVDRLSGAVARAGAGGVDVIVLDLSLPDSFGLDTLRSMRQAAPDVPIVVVTGQDDDQAGLHALNAGAQDYLIKGDVDGRGIARSLLFAIERRRFHEQLGRRDALVAEAQQIARLGSFEWDIASDQFVCSDEFLNIYGLAASPVRITYEAFRTRTHPEDIEKIGRLMEKAVKSTQPYDFEHRILRGTDVVVLHARGRIVVDASGQATRITGTSQDITERKKLEEKLLFAARMSSVETLAAGVAHEINNPLTYVVANLEFIAKGVRGVDGAGRGLDLLEVAEALDEARHGAERIRRIVRGLKTFSRADEERRVAVELQPLIELSINMTFNEIRHRARLVKDFGKTPAVDADESRLSQVFVNLLINAAQAFGDGNIDDNEIRVVTWTDERGRAVVEVRDNGAGIAVEHRGRIFDPFFTTKPVGVGTGLGLSICHGIVAAHGGELTLEPSGAGAVFRIALPPASLAVDEVIEPPAPRAIPGRRGRVLVIDDEPLVVSALRRILGRDHDVVAAGNGEEALALFHTGERFDAILSDVMMPVMSGIELYDRLSLDVPEQADKVIFITGGAFTPTAQAFLDRMQNPRAEKPFDSMMILALVRHLVR